MIKKLKNVFLSQHILIQMLIICVFLITTTQLINVTTSWMNKSNTLMFNLGLISTLILVFITFSLGIFVSTIIAKYIINNKNKQKQTKTNKNKRA
jgi:hypothetical protein